MIQKLLNNSFLLANIKSKFMLQNIFSNHSNKYYFSSQPEVENMTNNTKSGGFSPIDYYRNTVRRVNIQSTGRGKFTAYSLHKIINLTQTEEHAKIMFEAYYNYLGHFTAIPNKVVDDLISKSIAIGNQTEQIFEILSHHNYLTYFPSYDITNRFFKSLIEAEDTENLERFIKLLIRSPLIKINSNTVEILTNYFNTESVQDSTRQYIVKLFIFRRKLVDNTPEKEFVKSIIPLLENFSVEHFDGKPMILNAYNAMISENEDEFSTPK